MSDADTVLFFLVNSKGKRVDSFRVPASEADAFEQKKTEMITSAKTRFGEDTYTLTRLEKCF